MLDSGLDNWAGLDDLAGPEKRELAIDPIAFIIPNPADYFFMALANGTACLDLTFALPKEDFVNALHIYLYSN